MRAKKGRINHLFGLPSADVVAKDSVGLGEINALLSREGLGTSKSSRMCSLLEGVVKKI